MQQFTATAVQIRAANERSATFAEASEAAEAAARKGSALVALPELFFWRGAQAEELASAETIPGPTSDFAAALAKRLAIHLVAGSLLERVHGEARCFNTSLLFAPDGALLARYRKIHLFDIEVAGEVTARESRTRQPGSETVAVATELGCIGLAICYDLRFPELFRHLADAGAEIVVMPSAFTKPTGRAHWHALVRARAIENQCYFVAPNRYGPTQHGFDDYGHSLIVDPWGEILAEGPEDRAELVSARLDPARLEQVRTGLPSLEHRRL